MARTIAELKVPHVHLWGRTTASSRNHEAFTVGCACGFSQTVPRPLNPGDVTWAPERRYTEAIEAAQLAHEASPDVVLTYGVVVAIARACRHEAAAASLTAEQRAELMVQIDEWQATGEYDYPLVQWMGALLAITP